MLTGVEAKILDCDGPLDVPPSCRGDRPHPDRRPPVPRCRRTVVAVDDDRADRRPGSPSTTRSTCSSAALIGAMHRYPGNQLAHCFSILPKIGLAEDELGAERLRAWAETAAATDTLVEVNEKWACPGPARSAPPLATPACDSSPPPTATSPPTWGATTPWWRCSTARRPEASVMDTFWAVLVRHPRDRAAGVRGDRGRPGDHRPRALRDRADCTPSSTTTARPSRTSRGWP